MSVATLHEQLALQKMSSGTMSHHPSSLNAQLCLAQFIELKAAILARRALQPSNWQLQKALADRADSMTSDSNQVLKSAQHFEPPLITASLDKPVTKQPEVTLRVDAGRRIETPSELDILCGRGGKSNHHAGNKRYRQVVSDMKARYRSIGSKAAKLISAEQ